MKERLKQAFNIVLIIIVIIAYLLMFVVLYDLMGLYGIGADGS